MPLAAAGALLSMVFAPQGPARVEVIGPAPRPSDALRAQIAKGEDELLLFDVCYGVREVTGDLQHLWARLETERAEGMRALLDEMPRRCAGPTDAATVACANVAAVARALLIGPKEEPPKLEPLQRDELREVEAAAKGSMRFVPQRVDQDWSIARPVGAYANERDGPDGIAGLFRATVYLRRYLEAWPADTLAAWRRHSASCRESSYTANSVLGRVESQLPVLFGASVEASGVLMPAVFVDWTWLRANAGIQAPLGERLATLFAATSMPSPRVLRDGVLQLCHELTIAAPKDPLFGAMAPVQWQAKWRDAASFAYVGLREVDCLAGTVSRADAPPAPKVIVEPLPAVWEVLRWLDKRCRDPGPGDGWQREQSWIDPVLEALALQQKGEDLPPELNDALREQLLTGFRESDLLLGTVATIEGLPARVRRAVPQLVRIPIVWRGETKQALALRLFVEEQGVDGKWQGPPWGVALQCR